MIFFCFLTGIFMDCGRGRQRIIPTKQSMFQFYLAFQHLTISPEKLFHMENHKFSLPVPGLMVAETKPKYRLKQQQHNTKGILT